MFAPPIVNPRRAGRPRLVQGGFDLFEAAASSPPPQAMLDLGTVSGEALDLVGRQRRLVQMERQRDLLRAQGWATADLDAHITALNRSLRDSWRRNPRRRNPRSAFSVSRLIAPLAILALLVWGLATRQGGADAST